MSGAAAYRKHVSKGKCTDRTAEVTASKLLVEGSEVSLRVEELRDAANRITEQKLNFTKQDALQFLVDVIQTPVAKVDGDSRLCQEWECKEMQVGGQQGKLKRGDAPEGNEKSNPLATVIFRKCKMPGKLDAIKQLSVMCGWNAPEKHDVTLTGPRGVLAGIIKRK